MSAPDIAYGADTRQVTLLVVRINVRDVARLQRTFDQRGPMRADHGCTSARLLTETRNPNTLLVLMEFPSFERAQSYLTTATLLMDAGQRADLDLADRYVGYFDELPATL